jgi:hypothetical protein
MRHLEGISATCAAMLMATIAIAASPAPSSPTLKCDVGPVEKTFGNSRWLVYSCDDNRSIVLVSAPGSPAMPFVFSFIATGDSYRLSGEGTGQKKAAAAAFGEIKALSEQDIASFVGQTKAEKR